MEPETEECSRVPSHLKHLHRPTIITEPNLQQSYPVPHSRQRQSRNRSLRSTLKTIICKDCRKSGQRPSPPQTILSMRPGVMRMKDSDDYITARAANPRTGFISPSVGTRTPCTPASPGEALKLHAVEQISPTPESKTRPPLRKANEGRKISAGSSGQERRNNSYDVSGEVSQTPVLSQPSTKPFDSPCSISEPNEDRFVVHMPSAREPQPFAYPGYSADQIEALEHYRRKARRVSSEGYDRRLFLGQAPREDDTGDYQDCQNGEETVIFQSGPPHGGPFTPYNAERCHDAAHDKAQAVPRLTVRKRDHAKMNRILNSNQTELPCVPHTGLGGDKKSHTAVPDPTPSTPPRAHSSAINRQPKDQYTSASKVIPVTSRTPKHAEIYSATLNADGTILRKLISADSAPSTTNVANSRAVTLNGDRYQRGRNGCLPSLSPEREDPTVLQLQNPADLSTLPRVRLVRPEHAALPKAQRGASANQQKETCTSGCLREGGQRECVGKRQASDATVVRRTSLFEGQGCAGEEAARLTSGKMEMLVERLALLLNYLGSLQVPRVNILEILRASDVPAQEKIEALKAALSLAGHAIAVCTVLAMLWKLGAAVMHLLEVILWPLVVPIKIMRWIAG